METAPQYPNPAPENYVPGAHQSHRNSDFPVIKQQLLLTISAWEKLISLPLLDWDRAFLRVNFDDIA